MKAPLQSVITSSVFVTFPATVVRLSKRTGAARPAGLASERSRRRPALQLLTALLALSACAAQATGMVPETSLLLINEQAKGANLNVRNTDSQPALLYASIVDLADDKGPRVIVTQPVTRVDAGETQKLRFLLQTDGPLKVEHFKRLMLEGIPPKTSGKNQVTINIRQDLPVLIHPADLPVIQDAWTKLTWSVAGSALTVRNDSPYVVRMADKLQTLPSGTSLSFGKTYILPGQHLTLTAPRSLAADRQVTLYPVSRYGVPVAPYTTDLK
jgi:P pilus assembly chaperone PapD